MLRFTLAPTKSVYDWFIKARGRASEVLRTAVTQAAFQLHTKVVLKLTGEVLHVRTGILRGSVRSIPAQYVQTSAGRITIWGSVVAGEGPSRLYASVHEYGGVNPYEIIASKSRALRFVMDGKERYFRRVTHPPAPERSFMRSTEHENADAVYSHIEKAIKREFSPRDLRWLLRTIVCAADRLRSL